MTNNKPKWRAEVQRMGKRVWRVLSKNLGLKLLSVVCALFLWSYVISSSPTITREKTLGAIDVTVSGQSVLASRGLAVLTDIGDLDDARVRVRVAQSYYAQVSNDNVRVELDLSGVRAVGKQSVKLRGTSTYGAIVQVWPEYLELEIENQDQRYVPVNVAMTGEKDPNYWYSVSRINPSQITVTGPTSIVQQVSSAQASVDLTGRLEPHSRVEQITPINAAKEAVAGALSRSTNSVTLSVDIYPTKKLPITARVGEMVSGQVPEGYEIASVEVSPAQVVAAADPALLAELETLTIEPVNVTGARQTFTTIARINSLKGIKNLSSAEVSVTVHIQEQPLTKRFTGVALRPTNVSASLDAVLARERVDVKVTGPYSVVRGLVRSDIQASVDLAGLTQGEYELPIALSVDNYPELTCEASIATVKVVARAQGQAAKTP
ncbi:MAG: CdaR family protein [Clostridia bacterium]